MTSGPFSEFDRAAMARAVALAGKGLTTTHPNPRVGCVIARGERIVGEGWHERAGEPHAEIHALRAAGPEAAGATVYVTLEPCSHHGRTPPCADALIAAHVARVVFAVADPNPRVNGRGAQILRNAGIQVASGLLEREAAELNPGFLKRMRTGRPWVRLKLAMSLDGRTALANGASQWITGEAAREDVQHWRARSCAILTGIGTMLSDDPRLDVRLPEPPSGPRPKPLRVVLDSRLRTPPDARIFSTGGAVLILTSEPATGRDGDVDLKRRRLMEHAAVEVMAADASGRPRLSDVLDRLGRQEVNELWVEAGATLAGAFLQQSLADELLLYVAPKLLGPQARPLLDLEEIRELRQAPGFVIMEFVRIGEDLRLRLRPNHGNGVAAL